MAFHLVFEVPAAYFPFNPFRCFIALISHEQTETSWCRKPYFIILDLHWSCIWFQVANVSVLARWKPHKIKWLCCDRASGSQTKPWAAPPRPPDGSRSGLALIWFLLPQGWSGQVSFYLSSPDFNQVGLIKRCSGCRRSNTRSTSDPAAPESCTQQEPGVWESCKNNQRGKRRAARGWSICTVLYQADTDDLPEDFLTDVVELEKTLLWTYGCGQGRRRVQGEMQGQADEKDIWKYKGWDCWTNPQTHRWRARGCAAIG